MFVFLIFLCLPVASSIRTIDCTGCDPLELTSTQCFEGTKPGVLYTRTVEESYGCNAEFCDTEVCDTSFVCHGTVTLRECGEECDRTRRIVSTRDGVCIDIVVITECSSGEGGCVHPPLLSPDETYICTGCGDWNDVGKVCHDHEPSIAGQYYWRSLPAGVEDCDVVECGEFGCDVSTTCSGHVIEGGCNEKCLQRYRVWKRDSTGSGLCHDKIEYWPCDQCNIAEEVDNLQLLINKMQYDTVLEDLQFPGVDKTVQ